MVMHTCKECNETYSSNKLISNFCGNRCRQKFNYRQKTASKPLIKINCGVCGTKFESARKNAKYCSPECTKASTNLGAHEAKRQQNEEAYKDVLDIPTCIICGWKSRSLQGHLKTHNLTVDEYRTKYKLTNDKIFHSSYTEMKSERMTGENNPGFEHNGTMSSFSKNYKQYEGMSEEQKEAAIQRQVEKACATKDATSGYTTRLDYYQNRKGMTLEEAYDARADRQTTFSLAKCIEQYSKEVGQKRWEERQRIWRASIKDNEAISSESSQATYKELASTKHSSIAGTLFDTLVEHYPDSFYGDEELIVSRDAVTRYKLDFCVGNKVIEFNGDLFHANPNLYETGSMVRLPHGDVTTDSIWEREARKIEYLEALGYQIHVVWESDYKRNKARTLRECIEFLES